jgi:hypothetical protein
MWAVIEPPSVHPREMLKYRFLNVGEAPVHIENIEGDKGFAFVVDKDCDFFDPETIHPDPEPTVGDAPALYVAFSEKQPTKVYAVDSTGKKWPLPKKELAKIYETLKSFRDSEARAKP